ncbi:hypothetical protein LRR81_01355 [Metabacillus sp. GX 13764]|uniref:hypothetical protein n=1 Tax=Metabacillus kandeliae TaxID=2900151 RepID=UPI001E4D5B29|nr:hypothetical protein [Metabacillus kandeliae]MCD7032857.1 hypothetical protein [Metabacillus kandeliae]
MREIIKKFQLYGDKEVINYIFKLSEEDFLPYRFVHGDGRITANLDEPLKFVAYRIKSMEQLMLKKARSLQAGNIEYRRDLLDFAQTLSEDSEWLGINYDEVYKGDFSSFEKNWIEVAEYLGAEVANDLKRLLEHFTNLHTKVEEGRVEIRNQIRPIMIEALENALLKVDICKSDKEIVKYINRVWLSNFINLQVISSGSVRVQRNQKSYYVKPNFNNIDIELLVLKKTLKHVGGINSFSEFLNKNQISFVEEVINLVEEEVENKNYSSFHFDTKGALILNKRYLAAKMEMSESNFKHKLNRVVKKVNEKFNVVFEKNFNTFSF